MEGWNSIREGFYSIQVNSVQKVVNMVVGGSFSPEKVQQFLNDYHKNLDPIPASQYELRFDCRDLNVITQDMIPHLQGCFELYKTTGFKKVVVEIKQSAIIKMQLNRIAKTVGLEPFEVVEV